MDEKLLQKIEERTEVVVGAAENSLTVRLLMRAMEVVDDVPDLIAEVRRMHVLAEAASEMVQVGMETGCYGEDTAFEKVAEALEEYEHPSVTKA